VLATVLWATILSTYYSRNSSSAFSVSPNSSSSEIFEASSSNGAGSSVRVLTRGVFGLVSEAGCFVSKGFPPLPDTPPFWGGPPAVLGPWYVAGAPRVLGPPVLCELPNLVGLGTLSLSLSESPRFLSVFGEALRASRGGVTTRGAFLGGGRTALSGRASLGVTVLCQYGLWVKIRACDGLTRSSPLDTGVCGCQFKVLVLKVIDGGLELVLVAYRVAMMYELGVGLCDVGCQV
jgi:hypothetical protein